MMIIKDQHSWNSTYENPIWEVLFKELELFLFLTNNQWFGSESEDVLRTMFWDYSTSSGILHGKLCIDYSTRATGPSEDAHGMVWKVEVKWT